MRIGFFGALCLIFITLKLTGYVAWSWFWVLSPIWLPIAITILVMTFGVVGAVYFSNKKNKTWNDRVRNGKN